MGTKKERNIPSSYREGGTKLAIGRPLNDNMESLNFFSFQKLALQDTKVSVYKVVNDNAELCHME